LGEFVDRHIGPGPDDQAKMLAEIGYASLDELVNAAVPEGIRSASELRLPEAATEADAAAELAVLAARNVLSVPMIGLGSIRR
jgi:glycine dehydrogenase